MVSSGLPRKETAGLGELQSTECSRNLSSQMAESLHQGLLQDLMVMCGSQRPWEITSDGSPLLGRLPNFQSRPEPPPSLKGLTETYGLLSSPHHPKSAVSLTLAF